MPPRYSYWTIIAGGLPTAFRAADRDDLLPTFKRIQEKHADAEMKWFARGKLWESPEAARADTEARRLPPGGQRPRAADRPAGPHRGRDWRPGGEHRDPRQKFIDAKKDRNQDRRRQRFERKQGSPLEKPHGDPLRRDVPPAFAPRDARDTRPRQDARGKPDWRERPAGPAREKRDWRDRPPQQNRPPQQRREWKDRPPQQKREWENRPPREKPHGDPLRRDMPPSSKPPVGRARQGSPYKGAKGGGNRPPSGSKPRGGGGGGRR